MMGVLVSTEAGEEEKRISRRRLLKSALVFSVIGGGMIILGETSRFATKAAPSSTAALQTSPSTVSSASTAESTVPALQTPSTSASNAISGASVKVKVMYFQMPLTVNVSEEYFVLPGPANFRDLLSNVLEKHPALSPMIPTMMILIDGVPAAPGTALGNGDEVDFIPALAGG